MGITYADADTHNIVECTDLAALDIDQLLATIDTHHYAVIRGLFDKASIKACVNALASGFVAADDNPATGEPREAVRSNFQKIVLGGASLRDNNCPRFLRTFYNPLWCDDVYGMHKHFETLVRLRNRVYGVDSDFGVNGPEENGLWSATRIHQYPAGGGFFSGHTDYIALDVAREKSFEFFQLILVMNKKGVDYMSGGAFVDSGDKRYLLDDISNVGDVLVYDGRSFHGVEDIDSDIPLDMSKINGRIIAMATLYKI